MWHFDSTPLISLSSSSPKTMTRFGSPSPTRATATAYQPLQLSSVPTASNLAASSHQPSSKQPSTEQVTLEFNKLGEHLSQILGRVQGVWTDRTGGPWLLPRHTGRWIRFGNVRTISREMKRTQKHTSDQFCTCQGKRFYWTLMGRVGGQPAILQLAAWLAWPSSSPAGGVLLDPPWTCRRRPKSTGTHSPLIPT